MAERRMLSSKIICSDAFTEMPFSAQALYVQLVMEADDDGFLNNARRIQRTIEASEADLNTLLERRFLLGFDKGVICIKHWRIHNQIRKDRYTPTQYQDEFNSLDIKPDGAYTEKQGCELGNHLATTWQPNGAELATQVRLGKVSIGKLSIEGEEIIGDDPPAPSKKNVDIQSVVDLYHSICISFPKIRSLSEARKKDIKARLNTYTLGDYKTLFEKAEASAFLKGSNERNWTATFDWLIKDANMAKVLEDNYADKPGRYTRSEKKPNWMQPSLTLGQAEMDNIKRLMAEEDPAVAAEAEEMRKRMQEKYGKAVQ
jgi:hypothetical protein